MNRFDQIQRYFQSDENKHRDENWKIKMSGRSKAVVPVLFLFCLAFWFILRGASCLVLPCSLSSCFFSPLALKSPRLGKRELVYLLLVHLFVCFARVNFCPFSFPLGVSGWLRLQNVALPRLF